MGDEVGSAADIGRLRVSSRVSAPNFMVIENDDFWSCHPGFMPNC